MTSNAIRWADTNKLFGGGNHNYREKLPNRKSESKQRRGKCLAMTPCGHWTFPPAAHNTLIAKPFCPPPDLIGEHPYHVSSLKPTKVEICVTLSHLPMDSESRRTFHTKTQVVSLLTRNSHNSQFCKISRDTERLIIGRLKNLKMQARKRCQERAELRKMDEARQNFAKVLGNTKPIRKLTRKETTRLMLRSEREMTSFSWNDSTDQTFDAMLRRPRSCKHLSHYIDLSETVEQLHSSGMKVNRSQIADLESLINQSGPVLLDSYKTRREAERFRPIRVRKSDTSGESVSSET
ncbi:uncharacterized protein LOC134851316 [Symsagittifera roscoffensis]|uniref:uncharacterized protein LOC134851316 n=1 Tax=Symsagittifera roscoffensis TaxID=84072 RepID=UPI00307B6F62